MDNKILELLMLSYQHAYHAGCYADVIKHLILTRIISYLTQKDKPLLYLDTHSGRGLYDLEDKLAQKTNEFQAGIGKLWSQKNNLPIEFKQYIELVGNLNPSGLKYYPGSPQIAQDLLRTQDRIYLCELHPQEINYLKKHACHKNIYIEATDGLSKIKALVPPPEKRALIFIDPSYEVKTQYEASVLTVLNNFIKFPQGVYVLWYPIIDSIHHSTIIKYFKKIPTEKKLRLEFYLGQKTNMYGTGMLVINPPYTLTSEAKTIFQALQKIYINSNFIISSLDKINN